MSDAAVPVGEGHTPPGRTTAGLPGTPSDDERAERSDGLEREAKPVPTASKPDGGHEE